MMPNRAPEGSHKDAFHVKASALEPKGNELVLPSTQLCVLQFFVQAHIPVHTADLFSDLR